jgi:hypothetical protein
MRLAGSVVLAARQVRADLQEWEVLVCPEGCKHRVAPSVCRYTALS